MPACKITQFDSLPSTYAELVGFHMPRPLHDQHDYENTVEVIGALVGFDLNDEQADYLEALTTFVEKYEAEQPEDTRAQTRPLAPGQMLSHVAKNNKMSHRNVAEILGVDPSLVSHIVNGRRELTWEHAKLLSERFGLPPTVFMS